MLTALVTTPPVSAALTCSAVTTPARSCASAVDAPRCGVTTTSSRPNSGCSVIGSDGNTSSAAPATLPDSSAASSSASRSISSPRAQLTIRTPSFIAAKRLGVEPVDRLRGLRQVEADHVGALVELLAGLDALDAELAEALGGDELVEGDDVHVEGLRPLGDELADPAEADHSEGLAVELVAARSWSAPTRRAASERVGLRDVAEQRQRQRQRVLGGGDRVGLGRVGDDDPALGRGRDVDVVDARAGAADHLASDRPRSISSAVIFVAERITIASNSAIRSSSSPSASRCRARRRSARAAARPRRRRSSP